MNDVHLKMLKIVICEGILIQIFYYRRSIIIFCYITGYVCAIFPLYFGYTVFSNASISEDMYIVFVIGQLYLLLIFSSLKAWQFSQLHQTLP